MIGLPPLALGEAEIAIGHIATMARAMLLKCIERKCMENDWIIVVAELQFDKTQ
jgi:hypothetical protein